MQPPHLQIRFLLPAALLIFGIITYSLLLIFDDTPPDPKHALGGDAGFLKNDTNGNEHNDKNDPDRNNCPSFSRNFDRLNTDDTTMSPIQRKIAVTKTRLQWYTTRLECYNYRLCRISRNLLSANTVSQAGMTMTDFGPLLWPDNDHPGESILLPNGSWVTVQEENGSLPSPDMSRGIQCVVWNDKSHIIAWDLDAGTVTLVLPGKGDLLRLPDGSRVKIDAICDNVAYDATDFSCNNLRTRAQQAITWNNEEHRVVWDLAAGKLLYVLPLFRKGTALTLPDRSSVSVSSAPSPKQPVVTNSECTLAYYRLSLNRKKCRIIWDIPNNSVRCVLPDNPSVCPPYTTEIDVGWTDPDPFLINYDTTRGIQSAKVSQTDSTWYCLDLLQKKVVGVLPDDKTTVVLPDGSKTRGSNSWVFNPQLSRCRWGENPVVVWDIDNSKALWAGYRINERVQLPDGRFARAFGCPAFDRKLTYVLQPYRLENGAEEGIVVVWDIGTDTIIRSISASGKELPFTRVWSLAGEGIINNNATKAIKTIASGNARNVLFDLLTGNALSVFPGADKRVVLPGGAELSADSLFASMPNTHCSRMMQKVKDTQRNIVRTVLWDCATGKVLWTEPLRGERMTFPDGSVSIIDSVYLPLSTDTTLALAYATVRVKGKRRDLFWDLEKNRLTLVFPAYEGLFTLPHGTRTIAYSGFLGFKDDGEHFGMLLRYWEHGSVLPFRGVWNGKTGKLVTTLPMDFIDTSHKTTYTKGIYEMSPAKTSRTVISGYRDFFSMNDNGTRMVEYCQGADGMFAVLCDLSHNRDIMVFPSSGNSIPYHGRTSLLYGKEPPELSWSLDGKWLIQKMSLLSKGLWSGTKEPEVLWDAMTGGLHRILPACGDTVASGHFTSGNVPLTECEAISCVRGAFAATITHWQGDYLLLLFDQNKNYAVKLLQTRTNPVVTEGNYDVRLANGRITDIDSNGTWVVQSADSDDGEHKIRWDFGCIDKPYWETIRRKLGKEALGLQQHIDRLSHTIDSLQARDKGVWLPPRDPSQGE